MTRTLTELVAQVRDNDSADQWIWGADVTDQNMWRFSRNAAVKLLREFADASETIIEQGGK